MAIALVQSAKGHGGNYVNVASLSLPAPVVVGNLLVLAFTAGSANTIAALTDDRGNTWQLAVAEVGIGTGRKTWLYYAANAAAGATTISLTFGSGDYADVAMIMREYSGLRASAPLDVIANAADTMYPTSHLTSISPITADAVELVISAVGSPGAGPSGITDPVFGAGGGFGNLLRQSGFDVYTYVAIEDRVTSAAGMQVGGFSSVEGINGQTVLASFRQPVSAGTAYTKSLADSTTETDTSKRSVTTPRSDTVTPADLATRALMRSISDSVTSTDVRTTGAQSFGRTFTDSSTPIDAATRAIGRRPADTAPAIDVIRNRARPRKADSVVTTDALAKRLQKLVNDAVSMSDSAGSQIRVRALNDALSTSDAVTSKIVKSLTDAVATVDSRGEGSAKAIALSDNAVTTDATRSSVGFNRVDSLAAMDSSSNGGAKSIVLSDTTFSLDTRLLRVAKALVDGLTTTDSRRASVRHPLADVLTSTDVIKRAGMIRLDLADLVGPEDAAIKAVRLAIADSTTTVDRIVLPGTETIYYTEPTVMQIESDTAVARVHSHVVLLTNDSGITILNDKGIND